MNSVLFSDSHTYKVVQFDSESLLIISTNGILCILVLKSEVFDRRNKLLYD